MPTLLLEFGAVLVALSVVGRVASRLRISPIPIYLLVGLALGEGGVYPLFTAETFIEVGAEIGVVLLLLMLGLEYHPSELMSGLRSGASTALVDLVANATPGFVAGLVLGWDWLAASVLAGVTYISSSGIVAKVIDDFEWAANRETPVVLAVLVAEDLVMAVYLPLLGALIAGGGLAAAGVGLVGSVTAAVVVLVFAVRFGHVVNRVIISESDEALLLGVLGLTLVVAGVAERLHISAAVGAFLVGIAMSGPVQERARGMLTPLRDLFAATFFVFFGLSVDPGDIPPVLAVAAGLAAVTAGTKYVTAWWGSRRAGLSVRALRRAASLLVARGEFSIVIAEIGVVAGLHPRLGPLSATYVLLLAFGAPLLARVAAGQTSAKWDEVPRGRPGFNRRPSGR